MFYSAPTSCNLGCLLHQSNVTHIMALDHVKAKVKNAYIIQLWNIIFWKTVFVILTVILGLLSLVIFVWDSFYETNINER